MLSASAKKRLHDVDSRTEKTKTMEAALAEADPLVRRAVSKFKKKVESKDSVELLAVLTVLQLDLARKTEALRQANRGFSRLHKCIDRMRAEREMENAIFKRNMAMMHKGLFGPTVEPFKITYICGEGKANG